jgi:hypothetical protein
MRTFLLTLSLALGSVIQGATLEKLSVEQMAQKSTVIVRGQVSGCAGETRGSMIYTRCKVAVTERWKGSTPAQIEVLVPGGTAAGLIQVFTGTPKFTAGEQYVLFLWAGRSGRLQVIGLTQGAFDVTSDGKGNVIAQRAASPAVMLDSAGQAVRDTGVKMSVASLRQQVNHALGGASK